MKRKGKGRIVVHVYPGQRPWFELQTWSFDKGKWYAVCTSVHTPTIMAMVNRYYPGELLPIVPCELSPHV